MAKHLKGGNSTLKNFGEIHLYRLVVILRNNALYPLTLELGEEKLQIPLTGIKKKPQEEPRRILLCGMGRGAIDVTGTEQTQYDTFYILWI